MTPDQLRGAARNLARGLGIPVYIRVGRIYQDGPGLAFLPPNGDPAVTEVPIDRREEPDAANGALTVPKANRASPDRNPDSVAFAADANVAPEEALVGIRG